MPQCDLGQVQNFAARNDAKILLAIAITSLAKDPWATIYESGEWLKGEADSHTIVIGRNAAPADPADLVTPVFTDISQTCGTFPAPDSVGSSQYQYKLQRKKGVGPLVCLWQGIDAYKESYTMAAKSLADLVVKKKNADNRNIALQYSGLKATCNNTVAFHSTIAGTVFALATPFVQNLAPNTTPNLAYIKRLAQFLTTDLAVPAFEADVNTLGSGVPANVKVICSEELLEQFRNEAAVSVTAGFLTSGGYKIGEKQYLSYVWEGPFRGLGFAKDPQPIRFDPSLWPANGLITADVIVPPELPANLHNGKGNVPNPGYWVAGGELAFLIGGKGAFVREVLKGSGTITLGESSYKFPDQYNAGELNFFVPQGACDAFGEFGFHTYNIVRAVRPQYPHYIMPIAFLRCQNTVMPYCGDNTIMDII